MSINELDNLKVIERNCSIRTEQLTNTEEIQLRTQKAQETCQEFHRKLSS